MLSGINDAQYLDRLIRKIVDQKVNNIIKGNKLAGKIVSINGNRANCYVNGSSEITSNIPIRYGLTLKPNDEVWIERINFNDTDLEISSKRNVNNEQWLQWTNVSTFYNNWVNYGDVYAPLGYKKDAMGNLHLKGLIKNGLYNGALIFVLPEGYRPTERRVLDAVCSGGQVRIDIDANGYVYAISGASNTWLSLDGVDFQL